MNEPDGFREWIQAASPGLLRTAVLLTGDFHLAQDLLQSALARVWPKWDQIRAGNPTAYVRTTMTRLQASWWKRKWRGETPTEELHAAQVAPTAVEEQLAIQSALALLPLRHRQAVVLRFIEDMSVQQVADVMGCRPGTVKGYTSRGLEALRGILGEEWAA